MFIILYMVAKRKLAKKVDSLTHEWNITLYSDDLKETISEELKKIQARVHLDGFRNGHAPIDVVEKHYGEDALYRAVNSEIRKTIDEIVKDEEYNLAVSPEVTVASEIKKDKDINVVVRLVKKPEVPKINYEKFTFNVKELEMSEDDKNKEVERFRERMAKHNLDESGKSVEMGDLVDIDFIGRRADTNVEFPGGAAKGYKLEIGSHAFIDGFEDALIGHKKGDAVEIKVKFPEVYHSTELAGVEAIFSVKINDVFVKTLPELNAEFAKEIGFESMDKVRELLFTNMKNFYESQMKGFLKDEIFETIIAKNKFDLPESVIENELEERLDKEKEAHKDDKKFNEKEARKAILAGLEKSYASFYLTDAIAKENAIEVTDDEVTSAATQDAIRGGMDVNKVLEQLQKDEQMRNYIRFAIKEAKVFDFIYDRVKKNVEKLDVAGFEKFFEEKRAEAENANK